MPSCASKKHRSSVFGGVHEQLTVRSMFERVALLRPPELIERWHARSRRGVPESASTAVSATDLPHTCLVPLPNLAVRTAPFHQTHTSSRARTIRRGLVSRSAGVPSANDHPTTALPQLMAITFFFIKVPGPPQISPLSPHTALPT